MPNPSKLTKSLAEAIVTDVAAGLALALAAEAAGVHRDTVYGWLQQAKADRASGAAPGWADGESQHLAFSDSLASARAKFGRALATDLASGEKDHRALAYLERTRLARYYSDRALDEELLADRPDASSEGKADAGAVQVELTRCGSCGAGTATDEGRATFCSGCGQRLPEATP